jgi:hypothetical protein
MTVSVACHFAVNSFAPRAVDKRSHSNSDVGIYNR